uniref:Uncharacterized protein n=1 Tax=Macrostomum lignano TaxID=282301 RepID=A0A1I8FCW6_9PLAT
AAKAFKLDEKTGELRTTGVGLDSEAADGWSTLTGSSEVSHGPLGPADPSRSRLSRPGNPRHRPGAGRQRQRQPADLPGCRRLLGADPQRPVAQLADSSTSRCGRDLGEAGRVAYELLSHRRLFRVEPSSGGCSPRRGLPSEAAGWAITASWCAPPIWTASRSSGAPAPCTRASEWRRRAAPLFPAPAYSASISESAPAGSEVVRLTARAAKGGGAVVIFTLRSAGGAAEKGGFAGRACCCSSWTVRRVSFELPTSLITRPLKCIIWLSGQPTQHPAPTLKFQSRSEC